MDYARYVVQPGDTIYKIAKAYQVDMPELIHLNHLKHPDRIYPGQVLLLPVAESTVPTPGEIPEPNFTYAMWLFDVYAGKDSELSAVTTYLYQAAVLDRPEFDALLRPIAYDELRHVELLGIALRHLGVDPRYGSFSKGHWVDWRARYLNYTTELCALLDLNMEDEAKAVQHYNDLSQRIPIPEIQAILCQLAADEQRHYECFALAKQQFCCIEVCPAPSAPTAPVPEVPENGPVGGLG
ncbi:MAG: LysM peptidoglycan-binding domain-containing protein [Desulfitobacterium hafniense]|nr:LysM peptidoglycan-binding domain-containing protein [Desulfitobacterium hafniense]